MVTLQLFSASLVQAQVPSTVKPGGVKSAVPMVVPVAAPAQGVPIRLGMSAAFTGPSAGLGTEYYRGAKAYFDEVNALGGIGGRPVMIDALDDAYQPPRAVTNTVQLVQTDKVFALFNYVGTPTLTAALPVLKSFQQVTLVGDLTGAQIQRNLPYSVNVFNVRPAYREEMQAQVDQLWAAGVRRFGVFYQLDAYGRSGTEGVARALALHGASITSEATYRRGATTTTDMSAAIRHLKDAGVEVVLATGTYQAMGSFVRSARDGGWNVPITNVSFVSADSLLAQLQADGKKMGRDYTRNLLNSQVVPSYTDTQFAGVAEYRRLMDKWKPEVPAGLKDRSYIPLPYSFVGLEGFLNAKVLVQALRSSGTNPTPARFRSALERLTSFDLGIGAPLSFGQGQHQGLNKVYLTAVANGRWVTVDRWQLSK